MRGIANRILVLFAACALMAVVAFGGEKSEKVTFFSDVVVNGTVIKKGTYKVSFNEQTGEVTILKDKKTIAKTTGRVESRNGKALNTELTVTNQNNNKVLRSITFAGESKKIIVNDGESQVASPQ